MIPAPATRTKHSSTVCRQLICRCLTSAGVALVSSLALAGPDVGTGARGEPISLQQAMHLARQNRQEIVAASASASAARERARQSDALEDPMIMASIDHYPFERMDSMAAQDSNGDFDWSLTLEQRFPLTRVRSYRRQAAEAAADRLLAQADTITLNVMQQAADSFLMLSETQRMISIVDNQIALARQMVSSAATQMRTGRGGQTDVLRAEVELARLEGRQRALQHQQQAAIAMFNSSLGQMPDAPVPKLVTAPDMTSFADTNTLIADALSSDPALRAGGKEVAQAQAETRAMQAMYGPMAVVRAGPASTMAEGSGAMIMIGISIPLWRNKVTAGAAEGRAMELMARADLNAMRQMVAGETAAAAASFHAAQTTVLSLRDEVVPRARMAVTPALAAYANGNLPLATVIDTLQSLLQLEAELVMAETELARSVVMLERLTGRLLEITP
jgi:outer membrane protein, heavy metal efflux system